MKRLAPALLVAGTIGAAGAAELPTGPQIFNRSSWICRTPEDYTSAIEAARTAADVEELGEDLLRQERCLYLESDDIEDIFAPFVRVHERSGEFVKVSFTVEFYRRVGGLGGRFSTVKFTGWTDPSNLEPY